MIGTIRRECLDHMVVFGEQHLRRLLRAYADYYNHTRTHLSLEKDTPSRAPSRRPVGYIPCQFWADCIINTSGSNFRQGQPAHPPGAVKHTRQPSRNCYAMFRLRFVG
ncbi:MAG: integrase core domain-containing protein [Alphaproteobacteria bacterium]